MSDKGLRITNLRCSVAGNEILKGIDLTVESGRVAALMGPNGSGKSTLAFSLTGHPQYEVTGSVKIDGEELLSLSPDKRARAGLFLSFQYPAAIPGVKVANFLHAARQAERPGDLPPAKFRALLLEKMEQLGMDPSFMGRYLNDGFSGGEKKRLEMLQLAVLAPKYAVLDETDSGLDIDALKDVGNSIAELRASDEGRNCGLLIITHYPRILKYVVPDVVHVMIDGRIVKTGGPDLADIIERDGYDRLREDASTLLSTGASTPLSTGAVA
ncbi:MAG: Fe-S cluster assembly ATPase SufC [Candidatus Cybelea sp.]